MPSVKMQGTSVLSAGGFPTEGTQTFMGWVKTSAYKPFWEGPLVLSSAAGGGGTFFLTAYTSNDGAGASWRIYQHAWFSTAGTVAPDFSRWYFLVLDYKYGGNAYLRVFEDDPALTLSTNVGRSAINKLYTYNVIQSETGCDRWFTNFKAFAGRRVSDAECRRQARTRRAVAVAGCKTVGTWPLVSAGDLTSTSSNRHFVQYGATITKRTSSDEPRALRGESRRLSQFPASQLRYYDKPQALYEVAAIPPIAYLSGLLSVTARLKP